MEDKIYQVTSADSLAGLAEKYLGSVSNFRELASFNNLDLFKPLIGQSLKIPSVDQVASMVSAQISSINASNPLNEGIMKDLDLSGLRIGNQAFGSLPHQLISWLF